MTPTSGCGPVERGVVVVSLALETHVPTAGGVGLCQSYLPRLAELLNSKKAAFEHARTCPQRTLIGFMPRGGRSDRSLFKAHWSRRKLRCTHSLYFLTRQVCLGRCNEVGFHRFPSPSSGFPFYPFHFTHFFFSSFLSCLSLLHVLPSHSFLSLARTSVRALVCTRTSTVHLGFRSPRFW